MVGEECGGPGGSEEFKQRLSAGPISRAWQAGPFEEETTVTDVLRRDFHIHVYTPKTSYSSLYWAFV
jgi:hypothetical protein